MGLFYSLRENIMKIFKTDAEKEFGVEFMTSPRVESAQELWDGIIKGSPVWIKPDDENLRTVNFGKFLCQYISKKTCLDLAVNINGSERADFLNSCIKTMVDSTIRDKVEDMCGIGGIMFKPTGNTAVENAVSYFMPWDFAITEKTGSGNVRGCIFIDRISKDKVYYYRLEYHHFLPGVDGGAAVYEIQNRAFRSNSSNSLGKKIDLKDVPDWAGIDEVVHIEGLEKPLFSYIKTPYNNTIDYESPEGVAVFSNAITELRDLDIAWSMKGNEVEDSQHLTFIDENKLTKMAERGTRVNRIKIPRFIKGLGMGLDASKVVEEHTATMLTGDRIADINSILSMISTKCGFSQGQFVLDRKTGNVTATEVESDDIETVETINDFRKCLKTAIKDLIYALNAICDLNGIPRGYVNALDPDVADEDIFYFKDLLATFEQDRTRAYQLMLNGVYSKRKYLKEYEGFSDEEVDEMFAERDAENAREHQGGLFGEE